MRRSEPTKQPANQPEIVKANPDEVAFELEWHPLHEALNKWTGFMLFHVTELAGQMYAQAMASIRLLPQQVGVLQLLESEGPMVQARLSDYLSADKAKMVSLLNDLESQGLVARRPNPHDKRSYLVHLLDSGRDRLREAAKVNDLVNEQFFADLSQDERATLHQILVRLASSNRFT